MDKTTRNEISKHIDTISEDMKSNILTQIHAILINSGLSDEDRTYFHDKVRLLRDALGGDYSAENTRLLAEKYGTELLKELSNDNVKEPCTIQEISLNDNTWNKIIKDYSTIRKLGNNVGYQGGLARVIARKVLGIKANTYDDNTTLSDVDILATKGQDHNKLIQEYGADSRGISYLIGLNQDSIKNYMQTRDITSNQILITKDKLYITEKAIESLRANQADLSNKGEGFYGTNSYNIDGEDIYMGSIVERGLWALMNKKIDTLNIKAHNIKKDNLNLLNLKNDFSLLVLTLVRRLYEKKEGDKSQNLYNLAILLTNLGLINKLEEFFDYCYKSQKRHSFNIKPQPKSSPDIEFDARRKLKKYGKIILKTLLAKQNGGDNPKLSELEKKYDLSNKSIVELSLKDEKPSGDFVKKMEEFENQHQLNPNL